MTTHPLAPGSAGGKIAKRHRPSHSHRTWPILCVCLWTFGRADDSSFAQSRQLPAPPQSEPIVIRGATIHTVSGATIEHGYVLFVDGVIRAVGAGDLPGVAGQKLREIDATGMHVYPGLIAANSTVGLVETQQVKETVDHTEIGRFTPEVRAAVAVNPDSEIIPVTRANGVLIAALLPRGGAVSGRASVIRLDGWTWENMAIDAQAGLVVNWPRTEIITEDWIEKSEAQQRKEMEEDLAQLKRVFDDAIAYVAAKDADPSQPGDIRYEAMRAALKGEKPVFITAASAGQIESAVAWAVRYKLKPVIVGGQQADQCIELLKKHDVPVIINGTHQMPQRRHSAYDEPFTLAARLQKAGIRFAISSGEEAAHERNLAYSAATAAAYGLPRDDALKAITLYPAQILGIGDRYGSIEVGKSATLFVTTGPSSREGAAAKQDGDAAATGGDPLEITTDVLLAFIDGRMIDLGNRQKALNEKYREKYRQLGLIKP